MKKYKFEYVYLSCLLVATAGVEALSYIYGLDGCRVDVNGVFVDFDRLLSFSLMLISAALCILMDIFGFLDVDIYPKNRSRMFWTFYFLMLVVGSVWLFFAMSCDECRVKSDWLFYFAVSTCPGGIFFPVSMIFKIVRERM